MFTSRSATRAVLAVFLLTGCESAVIVDSSGSIEVAISTRGPDPDPDGYSLTVDGNQAYILPAAGSLMLHLNRGNHTVQVGGLADNCAVDGVNPRTLVVGSSGAADVTFTVVCVRATTGGVTVVVSTSGTSPDPDGYQLSVAGAETRPIPIVARETFTGLTPEVHLITLKGLAEGCSLTGGNPRPTAVLAGKTIEVRLDVFCGATGDPG